VVGSIFFFSFLPPVTNSFMYLSFRRRAPSSFDLFDIERVEDAFLFCSSSPLFPPTQSPGAVTPRLSCTRRCLSRGQPFLFALVSLGCRYGMHGFTPFAPVISSHRRIPTLTPRIAVRFPQVFSFASLSAPRVPTILSAQVYPTTTVGAQRARRLRSPGSLRSWSIGRRAFC